MKSDLIDIDMQIFAETAKAVLMSDTGRKENAVWLPKSQIEYDQASIGMVQVTMPEWLAKEKGLI